MLAPGTAPKRPRQEPPRKGRLLRFRAGDRRTVLWLTLFLAGYLFGLLGSRGLLTPFGRSFAAYYLDIGNFKSVGTVFLSLLAAGSLQLSFLLLSGFCALGLVMIGAYFAGKGFLLGLCTCALFTASGLRGLAVYWLLTWLPELSVLALALAFSKPAALSAHGLFSDAFCGGRRGNAPAIAKKVLVFYCVLLAGNLVIALAGAFSAIFFAAVLL